MANFRVDGLDEMMNQLERLSTNVEEIAKQAVNAAAPTLRTAVSNNLAAAANRGYSTGAAAGSVKASKAKVNNYGVYSAVTITGTDAKGTRNAEKAAYLEYGTSRQAAHPFMSKSVKQAEGSCRSTMEQVFESELNKYTK